MVKTKLLICLSLICSIGLFCPISSYCEIDLRAVTQEASNAKDGGVPFEEKAALEKEADPAQAQFIRSIFGSMYSLAQGRGIHIDKNSIFGNAETPEWLQRIQFGIDAGTNQWPRYYILQGNK